jgi:hypothetical protein
MYLTEEIARKLINLNPDPTLEIVDGDIAERQFQVILKGFNYLIQPENNFLYIADEVGLGKTYIAIGIASLLRYFSMHPENYNDVIIVPKQNLQYKWQKEINNFILKNYLQNDNIVKSILNKPAANLSKESIKHHLDFQNTGSNYIIFRNSSFSISSENDINSKQWKEKLLERLPIHQKDIFEEIYKKFSRNQIMVKRAFAYLLNQGLPNIDLLIVDEAHNFKHGVDGDISIRNQIVSRVFGAYCNDEELFNEFPELKKNLSPKVNKLLFLSATPINTQLYEIKRQLDCFLYHHLFKNKGDEKQTESLINSSLNKFLIRGLMTIKVNQKSYSRNSYRHEHRLGNVEMKEDAEPQYIKDNKTALVLCLMQYKTIKELRQNNNNQFEMGMLAGFESFENGVSKYEEETLENRKVNEAKDEQVIKNIVDSYYEEFSDYPPHPKQDSLVNEIFNLMLARQKSLVFVRRIASVRELEQKLLKKYSDYILGIIKNIKNYQKYTSLKKLVEKSELEKNREDIERIIVILKEKIEPDLKKDFSVYHSDYLSPNQVIESDLREIFNAIIENTEIEQFQEEIKNHIHRKNISLVLKELSIKLLRKKWHKLLILEDEIEDEEKPIDENGYTEEKSPYFFQRFFYNEGKNFKKRSYTKDWFELNLILMNDKYNLFQIDQHLLSDLPEIDSDKTDFSRSAILREYTIQALRSKDKNKAFIPDEFKTNTFLTNLLLELTNDSFSKWINAHEKLINNDSYTSFIDELDTLKEIIRSIFRQGSGLIPTFIAEALSSGRQNSREAFISEMTKLLLGSFNFVLKEIEDVLRDYDKIVEKNFDDKNKIRYNLIQQLPILGVSGYHKRDIRKTAIQFRMPGYPYVLIATDILKEGEDLHSYCKNIYHYGIAWNSSDMEQRTGRIDRIDSLAYRMIKSPENSELSDILFQKKLQVFYPYLTDTLEVNQMSRLFSSMNKFIDIFYNDLSIKIERNSKAQIDDLVDKIIPQRSGLLESKYDIPNFVSMQNEDVKLTLKVFQGIALSHLQEKITIVFNILKEKSFFLPPELDINSLKIVGILNIRNDRQGPFMISIHQKNQLGQFEYRMESCLGRVLVFGSHTVKQKIERILNKISSKYELKIQPIEKNSSIWLQLITEIEADQEITYHKLLKLIHLTDRLEESISKEDEKIDVFN